MCFGVVAPGAMEVKPSWLLPPIRRGRTTRPIDASIPGTGFAPGAPVVLLPLQAQLEVCEHGLGHGRLDGLAHGVEAVPGLLSTLTLDGDMVLVMGAGDIGGLAARLPSLLAESGIQGGERP